MYILAKTLSVIGKILVAYAAVKVHHRVMKEHQIDVQVFKSMRKEQKLAVFGIVFIFFGYLLDIIDHTS